MRFSRPDPGPAGPTTHVSDADAAPRSVGVVVVAAGSGTRLGAAVPKAFVELAGRSLLDHAVCRVLAVPGVVRVVVVVPAAYVERVQHTVLAAPRRGSSASRRSSTGPQVLVVAGGAERTDSVAAGLAALGSDVDLVLVHDAARALAPVALFERVIAALDAGAEAVVPGLPLTDTVKVVDADGYVRDTPDRALLRAIQTPQGFTRAVLTRAHASGLQATDDAALAEACGIPVLVVPGEEDALKITTRDDLARASLRSALLGEV